MRKVLVLNGKTEILSFWGVIQLFQPHFPAFCLDYYLTEFVPHLFHKSAIALIFSSVNNSLTSPYVSRLLVRGARYRANCRRFPLVGMLTAAR